MRRRGIKPPFKAMRCGDPVETRQGLRAWYRDTPGVWLEQAEHQQLAAILGNLFGYHLLQVGALFGEDCLGASRIRHRVIMDIDRAALTVPAAQGRDRVTGQAESLPFGSDSLDVVVLPHTLELSEDPHQVLREVDRVLIAEGHVVILGFNPWGSWMLWRLLLGWRGRVPWCARFLRLARVKDWLHLLGFDVVVSKPYFFRPPLAHTGLMRRLRFLERWGERWWPFCGGAYVLVAKKRVASITPIRPRWRPRRSRLAPGLVENRTSSRG